MNCHSKSSKREQTIGKNQIPQDQEEQTITEFSSKKQRIAPKVEKAEMKIVLTEIEEKICSLLKQVLKYLEVSKKDVPPIELRIAGGWVRDKLLGRESHDIDIAVDKLSGFEMANYVNEYLAKNGHLIKSIGKIQQNPDRSKHLETATTSIFGQQIDFVNLRSETYSENSRIPEKTEFGTPLQDALRRDITINSLFYNISCGSVEDFTEKSEIERIKEKSFLGLDDLSEGIIRTPIDPFETFKDDPLRVLRVIRFASRFGFGMVDEIKEALKSDEIKREFKNKISKERVGVEVSKMLSDGNQLCAIELIHDNGCLIDSKLIHKNIKLDDKSISSLYLAAYIYPFVCHEEFQEAKLVYVPEHVIKSSLKLGNNEQRISRTILKFHTQIQNFSISNLNDSEPRTRVDLGLLIREIGELWPLSFVFSIAIDLLEPNNTFDQTIERYNRLIETVYKLELEGVYKLKHIIDGKEIAKMLNIKPGPTIRLELEKVMEWQLANKEGTKEECKNFLALEFESLK
ncbi:hypothetical protein BB558_003334 [Smittium angustum]|uniref:Poly A polymerase head domain-containing protein n=1 Tax=Smittium angustum TaxID=133377 RepID=A0A2U1J6D1_SMIAN|nr:hypothetical protein BB558_003334 [Smittium angustum]